MAHEVEGQDSELRPQEVEGALGEGILAGLEVEAEVEADFVVAEESQFSTVRD